MKTAGERQDMGSPNRSIGRRLQAVEDLSSSERERSLIDHAWRLCIESRRAQGLPDKVEDSAALQRIAVLVSTKVGSHEPRSQPEKSPARVRSAS